jgi:hypothetical protein
VKGLTPSQKGAVAEGAVTTAAIELGLTVLRPLCEGRRYDIVIDCEPQLLRVQCKLARLRRGVLVVTLRTNRCTPNGYVATSYDPTEIDAVAAYDPVSHQCFLIQSLRRRDDAPYTFVWIRRRTIKPVGSSGPANTSSRPPLGVCTEPPRMALAVSIDSVPAKGAIAQLGERLAGSQKVAGSSPASSIGLDLQRVSTLILDERSNRGSL